MRKAAVKRKTKETDVEVTIDLDGAGTSAISTGIGFLDHMVEQFSRHSLIDVTLEGRRATCTSTSTTPLRNIAIALGQAVRQALGDMRGITRYADVHLPMDEALTRVAIDISGRPFLVFKVEFARPKIGNFDTQLVQEWFQAFAMNSGFTLHVQTLYGSNDHHVANPASRDWRGRCGPPPPSIRGRRAKFPRPRARSAGEIKQGVIIRVSG